MLGTPVICTSSDNLSHRSAWRRKSCQAIAKVLTQGFDTTSTFLAPTAAQAAPPSPQPAPPAGLQADQRPSRGARGMDLVACSRCSKVLMRAAAEAHGAACRAGRVMACLPQPPRGGKRSRSQSFEPPPPAAMRASPPGEGAVVQGHVIWAPLPGVMWVWQDAGSRRDQVQLPSTQLHACLQAAE